MTTRGRLGVLADEIASRDARVRVCIAQRKRGSASPPSPGFAPRCSTVYDLVLNMDATSRIPPRQFGADRCRDAGRRRCCVALVSGGRSRWLGSAAARDEPRHQHLCATRPSGSQPAKQRQLSLLSRHRIEGHRSRSRAIARLTPFKRSFSYRCRRAGCTFEEVPFVFQDRTRGESKIRLSDGLNALWFSARSGSGARAVVEYRFVAPRCQRGKLYVQHQAQAGCPCLRY